MSKSCFFTKTILMITAVLFFSSCSLSLMIKEPAVSSIDYGIKNVSPVTLTIIDNRTGTDSFYLLGKFGVVSRLENVSGMIKLENMGDPISYLSQNLGKEFAARKLPFKCVVGKTNSGDLVLEINRYQIINRRVNSFSPWEAMHVFDGKLINNGRVITIKSYFYNGKVPVWDMSEVEEPCFNIPISILIKDIASKINKAVFNYSAPNEKINQLSAEIDSRIGEKDDGPFWKVLELGYTDNPKAMEALKKYSKKTDSDFFKSCAVSAIGTLGAEDQFEFLKQRYNQDVYNDSYNDKYMTVKAIGDIGSTEAIQFIKKIREEKAYEDEWGLKCCVDLYAPIATKGSK